MQIENIILMLLIPSLILIWIDIRLAKKLIFKILRIKNYKEIKNTKDFMKKSIKASDILFESLSPNKYYQKFPKDFKKLRLMFVITILLFLPAMALIFYMISKLSKIGIVIILLIIILWIKEIAKRKGWLTRWNLAEKK